MTYLALFNILVGGVLCWIGYQTLRNPLPQYSIQYTTVSHRTQAYLTLGFGIFFLCVGLVLGMQQSIEAWLNPPPTFSGG